MATTNRGPQPAANPEREVPVERLTEAQEQEIRDRTCDCNTQACRDRTALLAELAAVRGERDAQKRQNVAALKYIAAKYCDEHGNPLAGLPQWVEDISDILLGIGRDRAEEPTCPTCEEEPRVVTVSGDDRTQVTSFECWSGHRWTHQKPRALTPPPAADARGGLAPPRTLCMCENCQVGLRCVMPADARGAE